MPLENQNFRILSLDGGGVRGLLTACILSNVENYLNKKYNENLPIGQRFDFIAGTSTGGLIALALATGKNAQEIVDFYNQQIPKIFPKNFFRKWLLNPFRHRYSSQPLKNALNQFFGDETLENLKTDVCITTISLQNGKPRFYKTDYFERNKGRLDEKLADIALATSSAPTYFKAHSLKHSSNLIDGGICANNPAMVALVDAFNFERSSKRGTLALGPLSDSTKKNAIMVSIGTGEQCAMPYKYNWLKKAGWLYWGKNFHEISIHSQSQLIHFQVKFLLGDNCLRINPELKFAMNLDDVSQMDELKNLADLTQETEIFLKKIFLPKKD